MTVTEHLWPLVLTNTPILLEGKGLVREHLRDQLATYTRHKRSPHTPTLPKDGRVERMTERKKIL